MDYDINNYQALRAGAVQQQTMNRTDDWRPMLTAPRDGTYIELKNTYGVAPSYCIARWTDEDLAFGSDGKKIPIKRRTPSWVRPEGGGPFDEAGLTWRPYNGAVDSYLDPTGGLQNSAAYWRGAITAKYGLPLDYFEAQTARNTAAEKVQKSPEIKGFWSRLFEGLR